MKKRDLADWLSLFLQGVVGLGFLLFALQHLMLGMIHNGPTARFGKGPILFPGRSRTPPRWESESIFYTTTVGR